MKAAILGVTGYTGQVLARLLTKHEKIKAIYPVSSSSAGKDLGFLDPGLRGDLSKFSETEGKTITIDEALKASPDIVFSALPHMRSAELCSPFIGKSLVIDLSADFRIEDPLLFRKAYGEAHPGTHWQDQAVFGLAEWYKEKISKSRLIANPGCYPTATLLPLLPLIKEGIIESKDLVINALSGVSGAGRKAKTASLYTERSENLCAYAPGMSHRHSYEIQKELDFAGPESSLLFTPHLIPMKRGMFITTSVNLKEGENGEKALSCLQYYYEKSPFVVVREKGIPETREVRSTNRCDIALHQEGDKLILMSCIDNLMKGASGQAVQNMNIAQGWDETLGLPLQGEV